MILGAPIGQKIIYVPVGLQHRPSIHGHPKQIVRLAHKPVLAGNRSGKSTLVPDDPVVGLDLVSDPEDLGCFRGIADRNE